MPNSVGDAAQVRLIAEQLFDTWKAAHENDAVKQRASWPAWLGLALAIFTLIFSAGTLSADVSTHNERITKVEQRVDLMEGDNKAVSDRLARIETKLDIVIEKRGGK